MECKLVLDIDPNTTVTHSVLDGNQNAYQYSFRPNDLQPNLLQTQTNDASRTTALQLQTQNAADIEFITGVNGSEAGNLTTDAGQKVNLGSGSAQLVLGQLVWTELVFKIADMQRIGSNQFTDLSQVRAIQFLMIVTGGFTIELHNLWVGGTFGPDTHPNLAPMVYRARYRSSQTGAASVPGPMMRTGITARRQAIALTFPASTDPQVDKIDIERLGGVNGPGFHYVQTISNSSPTWTDNLASIDIVVNPPLDELSFQPFPITDIPRTSVVKVSGSAVQWVSGDVFNLNWVRGTEVRINRGDVSTLSATPLSTTLMMVDDSMDLGSTQALEIPEATIAGQPLPAMWGPFYDTMFAVGDPNDAGAVLWTAEGNPDSAPDINYVEVTSPSETMMNGCMYDGRSYAFSDSRLFGVLQSQSFQALSEGNSGGSGFTFTEVRNGKGLAQRWSFCVGPKIWFVSTDGIYETDGSEPVSISQDIKGIFPKGDSPGVVVNGIGPVDMTKLLRLEYHNSYLFFDYTNLAGVAHTLIYDTVGKFWMHDTYFSGTGNGITVRYSEVFISGGVEVRNLLLGTNYGVLGLVGGTTDDGVAINCQFNTQAFNAGDPRSNKLFGDIVFDLDPQGVSITATPWINYFETSLVPETYSGSQRVITTPLDLNSGVGQFAQNLSIIFTWVVGGGLTRLYYWEPSYLDRPEDTFLRATDWTTDNHPGSKFLQGFRLIADTQGITRSIKIQGDQKDLQTFSVTHNGEETIPYSFTNPVDVSMMRILPLDEDPWRLFGVEWVWEPSPDLALNWQTQGTSHDLEGYQFLKEGYIAHNSTANLILNINVDGIVFSYPIANSGEVFIKTFLQFSYSRNWESTKGKALYLPSRFLSAV